MNNKNTKPNNEFHNSKKSKTMKTYIILSMAALTYMMTGCGGEKGSVAEIAASGDLQAIRTKKKELSEENHKLLADIKVLDEAITKATGERNLPLVTIFKAKTEVFDHYIELQGNVATKKNVLIYPEVSGVLVSVLVTEGQSVKKGQLLARIDDGGMSSQLVQMETQLALAKTLYERQERLWKQNVGTEVQYVQATANYETQKKAVDQVKRQLAKFNVTAPFSGVIDDVIKDQGTVVAPAGLGSEIFRIVNLSAMYLDVDVPENYVPNVKPNTQVSVYFPVLDLSLESKVRQTGNFINPDNRSFSIEVPVSNPEGLVKPNMTAKVRINDYTNEEAILIPQGIISENSEGNQYIYTAEKVAKDGVGVASKKIIKTGKSQGDVVEVLEGVTAGSQLIEEGARNVKEGQKVQILAQ